MGREGCFLFYFILFFPGVQHVYCAKFKFKFMLNGHPIINIVCCDVVSSCSSNACAAVSKITLLFNNWTHNLRYVLSKF